MVNTDLVSVVVPSYGHEDFILECLNSIYDQTHPDIELVVVDDCSNDTTFELAKTLLASSFGKRFTNVHCVRNDSNSGAHATINRGIQLSGGSHIAVINSDDLYTPSRLEVMLGEMRAKGSELAFSLVEVFQSGAGKGLPESFPPEFLAYSLQQTFDIQRDPTLGFGLMRKNIGTSTGNLVFTRALYDRVGPFLNLKYCHDWDFILQSLFYTEPVAVMQPLYRYRVHWKNSFSGLAHLAGLETEVVMRRFYRRGLSGKSANPLFPSEQNWPGYFRSFAEELDKGKLLKSELGLGEKSWRIYEHSN